MSNTTKKILITMAITSVTVVLLELIAVAITLSQPNKIAYQASEEDQCVMFLQTSNQTFYKLKSYEHGTCEYTKGDLK